MILRFVILILCLFIGDSAGEEQAGGQGLRQGPRTHNQRQPGRIRRFQVSGAFRLNIQRRFQVSWTLRLNS